MHYTIRAMQPRDVDGVLALQAEAYARAEFVPEGAAVFLNRMALAPGFCLVAERPDGSLVGYLVSHPWNESPAPALHTAPAALPERCVRWHVHDCVVAPDAKGERVGANLHLAGQLQARAAGLRRATLFAVGDAASYWARLGYRVAAAVVAAAASRGYGASAVPMERALA